jgi:BTB/POZ domain
MVDIYVGSQNTHWILHEKLLCSKSAFFNKIFYRGKKHGTPNTNKTFGLPDEEDEPFRLFVGWLYSGRIASPEEESELGNLFELYLMGEKWQIAGLVKDVLDAVRRFYRQTDTWPGLRRVQYIYANTEEDSPMRLLLISSVARMLVLGESVPVHWDRALKKNGQLAVDLIRAIQQWRLDPESIPDAREEAQQLEKEKVEEVEKAEAKQMKLPSGASSTVGVDSTAAAAGKDVEQLAIKMAKMPNGASAEDE